jgi:hypothetical protein
MNARIPNHRFFPQVSEIQYLPYHHCPQCGAAGRTTISGAWFQPYQDYFASALRYWQDHLGYINFQCDCQHQANIQRGLRVARLGDAILPVPFVDGRIARNQGQRPDSINAGRVQQAVTFLAVEADQQRTAGSDWLMHTLVALAAGGLSPEVTRRQLSEWISGQVAAALNQGQPGPELANLNKLGAVVERQNL